VDLPSGITESMRTVDLNAEQRLALCNWRNRHYVESLELEVGDPYCLPDGPPIVAEDIFCSTVDAHISYLCDYQVAEFVQCALAQERYAIENGRRCELDGDHRTLFPECHYPEACSNCRTDADCQGSIEGIYCDISGESEFGTCTFR
jgi:hypothetical protein